MTVKELLDVLKKAPSDAPVKAFIEEEGIDVYTPIDRAAFFEGATPSVCIWVNVK